MPSDGVPPPASPHPAWERYRPKRFFGSSHWWATEQLTTLPRSVAILDIGSGSGELGRALGERGFTELFAVEIDAESVAATRSAYRRVERELSAYAGGSFDVVLLLDIIEHVENPAVLLTQALALLRPGGVALISVPNIGHWSARLLLTLGMVGFSNRGILDPTHRHSFTRNTLLNLIGTIPNVSVLEASSSISPAEFLLPKVLCRSTLFRIFSKARWHIAQRFPDIAAYQHLVRITIRTVADSDSAPRAR